MMVSLVRVENRSGNKRFDDSAVQGMQSSACPFPPLPKILSVGHLQLVAEPTLPHRQMNLRQFDHS